MLALVLYIVAIVLFAVASIGTASKINLTALGLAFFAGASLLTHTAT